MEDKNLLNWSQQIEIKPLDSSESSETENEIKVMLEEYNIWALRALTRQESIVWRILDIISWNKFNPWDLVEKVAKAREEFAKLNNKASNDDNY